MRWWSPFPAARQSRLPWAGVVASAHVIALYPPYGPYRVMRSGPWRPDRFGKRGRSGERIRSRFSRARRLYQGYGVSLTCCGAVICREGGSKLWALGVAELEIASNALDVSHICAELGAEGGASSGWTTSSMLKRSSYGFGKLTSRATGNNAI